MKYYKLFNFITLPDTMNDYWTLFNRYLTNNSSTASSRTFFPFPDLEIDHSNKIVKLSLWHCSKVYLFSFFVRFLEIVYFL